MGRLQIKFESATKIANATDLGVNRADRRPVRLRATVPDAVVWFAMSTLTRRQLFQIFPAAGCAGCLGVCAAQTSVTLRADEKTDMSYQDLFNFAYGGMIPTMLKLRDRIGAKPFLEMLQKAAAEANAERMAKSTLPVEKRTMAAWASALKNPFFAHTLVYEVIKEQPAELEIRVSRCLWAKTFRGAGAADIGYASMCYPDFAGAAAWNPKLKMIRSKTLMQGDEYCNHRYVMEGA